MLRKTHRSACSNSYSHGVDEFVENKGGFWFLPSSWQGEIDGDDTGVLENEWYSFLVGTLKKTEKQLIRLNKLVFGAYIVALLLAEVLLRVIWYSRNSVFIRAVRRLLVWNGVICVAALLVLQTIDESNWAKDIQSGKAFQLQPLDFDTRSISSRDKATFPTEIDILIAPQYASHHLEGYGEVLNYAHPGNVFWKKEIDGHSSGYRDLAPHFQLQLCASLISFAHRDCRFLKLGEERQWVVVDESEELQKFCHLSLLASTLPAFGMVRRELDSLRTLTRYGRFRGSVMQGRVTISYIDQLEKALLPQLPVGLVPPSHCPSSTFQVTRLTSWVPAPALEVQRRRYLLPPPCGMPKEPFELAWLGEGDVIEAMYRCSHNGKCRWFLA